MYVNTKNTKEIIIGPATRRSATLLVLNNTPINCPSL